jgi:hypothetical protein
MGCVGALGGEEALDPVVEVVTAADASRAARLFVAFNSNLPAADCSWTGGVEPSLETAVSVLGRSVEGCKYLHFAPNMQPVSLFK